MENENRGVISSDMGQDQDQDQGQAVGEIVDDQKLAVVDQLTELVDLLAKDNEELSKIANHAGLLNQSQQAMMEQITEMNQRLRAIADQVDRIAEHKPAEPDKTDQDETEVQDETEKS